MSCPSGKVPYPSPQEAHRTLAHFQRRKRVARSRRRVHDSQAAYRCPECGSWHLRSRGLRR